MQHLRIAVLTTAIVALFQPAARSQDLMTILGEELKRNFESLKQKGDPPPYFLSYEVTDEET